MFLRCFPRRWFLRRCLCCCFRCSNCCFCTLFLTEDFCCCVTFAYLFKCLRDKFIESFAVRTPSIFSSVKYRTHFQHASMSAWGESKPPKKRSSSATLNTKHRHTFNEFILRILIPLIHMGTTARNLC